ncbi:MAG: SusE domain-containing protein [Bacteroidota bacterium]
MKVTRKLVWLAALVPAIWACENYEMPPVVPQTGASLSSPTNGTALVLTNEGAEDLIEFQVTAADFGMQGTVTYALEMDLAGANFSDPVELGSSPSNIIEVVAQEINEELISKGASPDVASEVEFRVKSSINQPLSPIYGDVVTLSVTPFSTLVEYPVLYLPGDYQGWNPGNEATTLKSVNFDDTYEGFVHILPGGTGEFKVSETNEWVDGRNYGDNDADGDLDADGANIKVTEFGTFFMTVDLAAKTYSLSDPLYWGIIGDATPGGWDSETKLQFDRDQNVLTITEDLTAGEMKFRANQDWAFNYGGANGELTADGANIAVEEDGNYTIILNFTEPGAVSYTITKN